MYKRIRIFGPTTAKGAGAFHSVGQTKVGNLVLALPGIRFS